MNLLQLFLQYLPQLAKAASSFDDILAYIKKVRGAAQQTGEWTPEAEEAFNAEIERIKTAPEPWQKPEGT